ncbi:PSD1 and planctomycete cytochrome C domain-containing protein [Roseimaritima sediminicola]|uniref:PSD1 and planctomycete cytochrome C domain-containing protein n=1 Tax=Roseimaritima sediminicola TaxID=2662066 RepID=UPI0012983B4D|nr:PSD1 and planctomycete cytochrome C domain-containing protein [Roseimaritima sediminicola]
MLRSLLCFVLLLLGTVDGLAETEVDYLTKVKPLLETKCYACHGRLKQEAGLRLETVPLMEEGGAVYPGDAEASSLIERVTAEDDLRMPPPHEGSPLTAEEVQMLRRWIDQGAPAPEEAVPGGPLEHWAFQPISRPAVPEVAGADGSAATNPIDALLAARHAQAGVRPVGLAPRSLRLRRLYLDLIGLPPTVEQLNDDRRWEVIVDELLHDPQHGVRWARHWMDVWRYSDWYGLGKQLRYSQKHMWHWRDWIIASLNADKGYDRMIHEMLAGDELAPTDRDALAATGFLARNYYLFNRTTWLDSTVEHTGKAFLGLTLNCAKCHDHKYDPISHKDYYQFRALFEPHQVRLDPVPGTSDFDADGLPRVFDNHLDATTHLHLRGDPTQPDLETTISPSVPELFASYQPPIEPVRLPPQSYAPALRPEAQQSLIAAADAKVAAAKQRLDKAHQAVEVARQKADAEPSTEPSFHFHDDFDAAAPDDWELSGPGWEYRDGMLIQSQANRDQASLRLRHTLPRDFEVRCRYTTTGGPTYRSVTFRFDASEDGRYSQSVYTSAHAPGPKVQVALSRDGKTQYPGDGRVAMPIPLDKPLNLRFAVRDRLVNVWIDDAFVLAYQLPDRRPEGTFSLAPFDATAAFDAITIRSLAADVTLKPAANAPAAAGTSSVADAKAAAERAAAAWELAKAERTALASALAADTARYAGDDPTAAESLAEQAAIDQAFQQRAEAALKLLEAGEDEKKQQQAEKLVQAAEKQLQAARAGEGSYRSVRASRKALETPEHKFEDYPAVYPATSSGRRLALARWMTARENPLTARVAVNHVWMRHFGEPLVENVFDFGLQTPQPVLHEVLDYLASEFIESGWSFRHLHRLICTSDAYQRDTSTAAADPASLNADPENDLYWHAHTRRMEAQVVRDTVLHLAGVLDLEIGGPSVAVDGDSVRRSIYFRHSRDDHNRFLSMFDDADLLQCYRRVESVVPQQALAMANSKLTLEMAGRIGDHLAASSGDANGQTEDDAVMVTGVFTALLGRQPDPQELAACLEYCDALRRLWREQHKEGGTSAGPKSGDLGDNGNPKSGDFSYAAADDEEAFARRVRTRLVHTLMNHNDFVSIR